MKKQQIIIAAVCFVAGLAVSQTVIKLTNDAYAQARPSIQKYTGYGSGVFESGTLLEIPEGQEYSNPNQRIGNLGDPNLYPGSWVIRGQR